MGIQRNSKYPKDTDTYKEELIEFTKKSFDLVKTVIRTFFFRFSL